VTNDLRQRAYWEDEHGFRTYDHPAVCFFALQRIGYICTWLDLQDVKSTLDVGCGSGFSTYYMQKYIPDIWAVDQSNRMLAQHPLRNCGRVSMADALKLPFADNVFDLVYGWEILHHLSDPRLAVAEMARVSRRHVLVAEPNRSNLAQFAFALLDREHRWVLRYTLEYVRGLFESEGLKIEHSSRGGWVFPNVTPLWLLPLLRRIPYRSPLGVSNWVLGSKCP
jgi:SAM-dependent methyltransferase